MYKFYRIHPALQYVKLKNEIQMGPFPFSFLYLKSKKFFQFKKKYREQFLPLLHLKESFKALYVCFFLLKHLPGSCTKSPMRPEAALGFLFPHKRSFNPQLCDKLLSKSVQITEFCSSRGKRLKIPDASTQSMDI